MRELLPNRRSSWTQEVVIENTTFLCGFGEYPDGRLGEVFISVQKEGTSVRGVFDTLARAVSIALQSGTSIYDVVKSLRHMNFSPSGKVEGSLTVAHCTSFPDYLAQEIEASYIKTKDVQPLQ